MNPPPPTNFLSLDVRGTGIRDWNIPEYEDYVGKFKMQTNWGEVGIE